MANNWSRFTKNTQKALEKAQFYAYQYSGDLQVLPEHLLLGILAQPKCKATRLLYRFSNDPKQIEKDLKPNFPTPTKSEKEFYKANIRVELSPGIKQILQYAVSDAVSNNLHQVNTRSLLIGLLKLNSIKINRVLRTHDITLEIIQSAI